MTALAFHTLSGCSVYVGLLVQLTSISLVLVTSFQVVPERQVDSPGSELYWDLHWYDEFPTSGMNFSNFQRRFPGWAGTPPAANDPGNTVLIPNRETFLRIRTKVAPSFDYPSPDESCSCPYNTYTTGMAYGVQEMSSDGGFIEIRARLSDSRLQTNFWLQGSQSEVSAFEIIPQFDNGSYTDGYSTAVHAFDSSQTLGSLTNSTSALTAAGMEGLTTDYHIYGIGWNNRVLRTYIDGVLQTEIDASGLLPEGTSDAWRLIIDSSVSPARQDIPTDQFPFYLRVDYVRAWTLRTVENYNYLPSERPCARGQNRVRTGAISGKGHTVESCAAGCESLDACTHFSVSTVGWCLMFSECTVREDSTNILFERIVLPTAAPTTSTPTSAPSPPTTPPTTPPTDVPTTGAPTTEAPTTPPTTRAPATDAPTTDAPTGAPTTDLPPGVVELPEHFSPRVGFRDVACDDAHGAVKANRATLGGGGHTQSACADACMEQPTCTSYMFTRAGYCKLWQSCAFNETKEQDRTLAYGKTRYTYVSDEVCDRSSGVIWRSKGGGGHSQQTCEHTCNQNPMCQYYVYYSASGFCHVFMDDCTTRVAARFGSQLFRRNFISEGTPEIEGYTLNKQECDINGGNDFSGRFSLGGRGHSLESCHEACTARSDCNFFNWAGTGFCHMYTTCANRRNLRHWSVSYSKASAPLLLGSASSDTASSTSTGALVFAVGALVGAVALVAYHYVKNKSAKTASAAVSVSEAAHDASSRLLPERDSARV
eukprot:m.403901 g.403901  ORF g.403901 m.403901 type:complete len:765 (+) comp21196_c0_seq2:508-2802(+)